MLCGKQLQKRKYLSILCTLGLFSGIFTTPVQGMEHPLATFVTVTGIINILAGILCSI